LAAGKVLEASRCHTASLPGLPPNARQIGFYNVADCVVVIANWPWDSCCRSYRLRSSLTRTALPCDRGTLPGDLTTTSQVTPIRDLIWPLTCFALAPRSPSASGASGLCSTSTVI